MPIGNGDVTSSVWVEETTGDLRILLSKADVFDENSQPVRMLGSSIPTVARIHVCHCYFLFVWCFFELTNLFFWPNFFLYSIP